RWTGGPRGRWWSGCRARSLLRSCDGQRSLDSATSGAVRPTSTARTLQYAVGREGPTSAGPPDRTPTGRAPARGPGRPTYSLRRPCSDADLEAGEGGDLRAAVLGDLRDGLLGVLGERLVQQHV